MSRKTILTIVKLIVAISLITWVIQKAGWENIKGSLANMDATTWAWGLGVILLGNAIAMWRWHYLMRAVGLDASVADALRLGFIGLFFNNIVPGLTGGDLVKAIYIARDNPGRRADAVVTVIVDRIIGIVALALIAAAVVPFDLDRYGEVATIIYVFLGLMAVGAAMALSRRIKKRLRSAFDRLGRKPRDDEEPSLLGKLDRAVSMYRERLGALTFSVVVSFAVHLCIITGCFLFGSALAHGGLAASAGDAAELTLLQELGYDVYCSMIPVVMMISAVPIAPAGWGVGETAFVHFFGTVGVSAALAASLSFTFRLTSMFISLLGGLFLVVQRRPVPQPEDS